MRKTPKISTERLFGQELAQGGKQIAGKSSPSSIHRFFVFAHHKLAIEIVE